MKYSKQLRLLRKPAWVLHYVDYELLRRYCNERASPTTAAAAAPPAASPTAATPGDADDERGCCDGGAGGGGATHHLAADALVRGLSPAAAQDAFLAALRAELARADAFFSAQLDALREALHATAEMVHAVADAGPGLDDGDIRVPAARAALLDVSSRLDDLTDFAALNTTACAKAAKKFDKHWGGGGKDKGKAKGDDDAAPPATAALAATRALLAGHRISAAAPAVEMSATLAALAQLLPAPAPPPPTAPPAAITMPLLDGAAGGGDDVPVVPALDLAAMPPGSFHRLRLSMGTDPLSEAIALPVLVAKGARAGPVLGISSAVHGNELNGIPVIHRLFRALDCATLCGTVVAVPVVNTHGYVRYR